MQNILESGRQSIYHNIHDKALTKTKYNTYLTINPLLVVSPVYSNKCIYIPDFMRISFTRLRLSSHNLKVETGRWFRRTPHDLRICNCNDLNQVQNEYHVLFVCEHTKIIRQQFHSFF